MKRLYPRRLRNRIFLSRLLESYVQHLEQSELRVSLRMLAYNIGVSEPVLLRMTRLYRQPEEADEIVTDDFHIVFSNVMFHFPTIRIWLLDDGSLFFEM